MPIYGMGISTRIWRSEIDAHGSERSMMVAARSSSVELREVYVSTPEKKSIDSLPPDRSRTFSIESRMKISQAVKRSFELKRAVCRDES